MSSFGIDGDNSIYATGNSNPLFGKNGNVSTVKFTSSGEIEWSREYSLISGFYDIGYDIIISDNSNVYVTGQGYNGTNNAIITIKYTQCYESIGMKSIIPFDEVKETDETQITSINKFNLYPNPNGGDMTLLYELVGEVDGELIIYSIQGKELKRYTLMKDSNQLNIPNDDSLDNGIYIYNIISGNDILLNDKLVILR